MLHQAIKPNEAVQKALKDKYKSEESIDTFLLEHNNALNIDTNYVDLVLIDPQKEVQTDNENIEPSLYLEEMDESFRKKVKLLSPEQLIRLPLGQNDNSNWTILIGRAGIGKSTLCQRIARQWAKGEMFPEVPYLFWIKFRDIAKVKNYAELAELCIKKSTRDPAIIIDDIANILSQNQDQCLLLLDGYDEIVQSRETHVISLIKDFMQFPNVILSTRPNQEPNLKNARIEPQRVEVMGFSQKKVERFIRQYFKENNDDAELLLKFLNQQSLLRSICYIPLNLHIVCLLYKNKQLDIKSNQPLSLSQLYNKFYLGWYNYYNNKVNHSEPNNIIAVDKAPEMKILRQLAYNQLIKDKATPLIPEEEIDILLPNVSQNVSKNMLCNTGFLYDVTKLSKAPNSFQFLHKTMQEFLAARFLLDNLNPDKKDTAQFREALAFICDHKYEPRFQNVIRFLTGLAATYIEYSKEEENVVKRKVRELKNYIRDALFTADLDWVGIQHVELIIQSMEESQIDGKIDEELFPIELVAELDNWMLTSVKETNNPIQAQLRARLRQQLLTHPKVAYYYLSFFEKNWLDLTDEAQRLTLQYYIAPIIPYFPESIEFVLKLLNSSSKYSYLYSSLATIPWQSFKTAKIRDNILDSLLHLSNTTDHTTLILIISALDQLLDPQDAMGISMIKKFMNNPNPVVKHFACYALDKITGTDYVNLGEVLKVLCNATDAEQQCEIMPLIVKMLDEEKYREQIQDALLVSFKESKPIVFATAAELLAERFQYAKSKPSFTDDKFWQTFHTYLLKGNIKKNKKSDKRFIYHEKCDELLLKALNANDLDLIKIAIDGLISTGRSRNFISDILINNLKNKDINSFSLIFEALTYIKPLAPTTISSVLLDTFTSDNDENDSFEKQQKIIEIMLSLQHIDESIPDILVHALQMITENIKKDNVDKALNLSTLIIDNLTVQPINSQTAVHLAEAKLIVKRLCIRYLDKNESAPGNNVYVRWLALKHLKNLGCLEKFIQKELNSSLCASLEIQLAKITDTSNEKLINSLLKNLLRLNMIRTLFNPDKAITDVELLQVIKNHGSSNEQKHVASQLLFMLSKQFLSVIWLYNEIITDKAYDANLRASCISAMRNSDIDLSTIKLEELHVDKSSSLLAPLMLKMKNINDWHKSILIACLTNDQPLVVKLEALSTLNNPNFIKKDDSILQVLLNFYIDETNNIVSAKILSTIMSLKDLNHNYQDNILKVIKFTLKNENDFVKIELIRTLLTLPINAENINLLRYSYNKGSTLVRTEIFKNIGKSEYNSCFEDLIDDALSSSDEEIQLSAISACSNQPKFCKKLINIFFANIDGKQNFYHFDEVFLNQIIKSIISSHNTLDESQLILILNKCADYLSCNSTSSSVKNAILQLFLGIQKSTPKVLSALNSALISDDKSIYINVMKALIIFEPENQSMLNIATKQIEDIDDSRLNDYLTIIDHYTKTYPQTVLLLMQNYLFSSNKSLTESAATIICKINNLPRNIWKQLVKLYETNSLGLLGQKAVLSMLGNPEITIEFEGININNLPDLIKDLEDPSHKIREQAYWQLLSIKKSDLIPVLIELVSLDPSYLTASLTIIESLNISTYDLLQGYMCLNPQMTNKAVTQFIATSALREGCGINLDNPNLKLPNNITKEDKHKTPCTLYLNDSSSTHSIDLSSLPTDFTRCFLRALYNSAQEAGLPLNHYKSLADVEQPQVLQKSSYSFFNKLQTQHLGIIPALTHNKFIGKGRTTSIRSYLDQLKPNDFKQKNGYSIAINPEQEVLKIKLDDHSMEKSEIDILLNTIFEKEILPYHWTTLDLSDNQLNTLAAYSLGELLGKYDCLRILKLSNNQINEQGCDVIFEALARNPSVKYLLIDNNLIYWSSTYCKRLTKANSVEPSLLDQCQLDYIDVSINYIPAGEFITNADIDEECKTNSILGTYKSKSNEIAIKESRQIHSEYKHSQHNSFKTLLAAIPGEKSGELFIGTDDHGNTKGWAQLALVGNKTNLPMDIGGHAYLAIERINPSFGQRELIIAELILVKDDKAKNDVIKINFYLANPTKFLTNSQNLSNVYGQRGAISMGQDNAEFELLTKEILHSKNLLSNFESYKMLPGNNKYSINCLKWATQILEKIGIHGDWKFWIPHSKKIPCTIM